MKRNLVIVLILTMFLVACTNSAEEIVPKEEKGDTVFEISGELENIQIKSGDEKVPEAESEKQVQETEVEQDTGFTTAIDPITIPDPSTQSEFVVEVTPENFLSIFEFVAVNQYNTWGEYDSKICDFSSLLYEQGWALGKVENYAVEYAAFDDIKMTTEYVAARKAFWMVKEENAEVNLRIYRAKGTLTFYPVGNVSDEIVVLEDRNERYIKRTLPDGSVVYWYTDMDGIMMY